MKKDPYDEMLKYMIDVTALPVVEATYYSLKEVLTNMGIETYLDMENTERGTHFWDGNLGDLIKEVPYCLKTKYEYVIMKVKGEYVQLPIISDRKQVLDINTKFTAKDLWEHLNKKLGRNAPSKRGISKKYMNGNISTRVEKIKTYEGNRWMINGFAKGCEPVFHNITSRRRL